MSISAATKALTMDSAPAAITRRRQYDALVREHGRAVHAFLAGMLGDAASAEDVSQEVFLRAWRGLDGLRDSDRARAWLFAIAANTARSHRVRRARHAHRPLEETALDSAGADLDMATRSQESLRVRRALTQLPTEDRQILLLVGVEGLTAEEAAETLGISVSAASKRWQRACVRFQARLEGGAA